MRGPAWLLTSWLLPPAIVCAQTDQAAGNFEFSGYKRFGAEVKYVKLNKPETKP